MTIWNVAPTSSNKPKPSSAYSIVRAPVLPVPLLSAHEGQVPTEWPSRRCKLPKGEATHLVCPMKKRRQSANRNNIARMIAAT